MRSHFNCILMIKMEKDTLVSFWVSDYPPGIRDKIKNILETKDSTGFKTTIRHRKDAQLDSCLVHQLVTEAISTSPQYRIDIILLGTLEIKQRKEAGGFWAFTNAKRILDLRYLAPEHGIIFVGAFPLLNTDDCPTYDKDSNFFNLCLSQMVEGEDSRMFGWKTRFNNPCNMLSDSKGFLSPSLYEPDGVSLTPNGLYLALTSVFKDVGQLDRSLRTPIYLHIEHLTKLKQHSTDDQAYERQDLTDKKDEDKRIHP